MANLSTSELKSTRDFTNVLDSFQNYASVQTVAATGAVTVADDTALFAMQC